MRSAANFGIRGLVGMGLALVVSGCEVSFGEAEDGAAGAAGAGAGTSSGGNAGQAGGVGSGGTSGSAGSAGSAGAAGGPGSGGSSGGLCAPGSCLSVDLAVGLQSPERVVVDDGAVYFTDTTKNGRLLSVKKSGADITTLVEQSLNGSVLAQDKTRLFIAGNYEVYAVPKQGGAAEPLFSESYVKAIVPTADGLWVPSISGFRHYHFGKKKFDQFRSETVGFAVYDATHIYPYQTWVSGNGPVVSRMLLSGGTLAPLATSTISKHVNLKPQALVAVEGDWLFHYFHTDPTALYRVPKVGGAPRRSPMPLQGRDSLAWRRGETTPTSPSGIRTTSARSCRG